MDEKQNTAIRRNPTETKAAYTKPELTDYGSVLELTLSGGSCPAGDAGGGRSSRC